MSLVTSATVLDELVKLEEAKTHLRLFSSDFDAEVATKLTAAREWVENNCARTLRASTTRTVSLSNWWCGKLKPPYPPLLGVTSVYYYDTADANTLLASSNYHIVSDDNIGWIEWDDDAVLPSLADRPDAVRIAYTCGYTAATFPAKARVAILLRLDELWGVMDERRSVAQRRASIGIEAACDWGSYS